MKSKYKIDLVKYFFDYSNTKYIIQQKKTNITLSIYILVL